MPASVVCISTAHALIWPRGWIDDPPKNLITHRGRSLLSNGRGDTPPFPHGRVACAMHAAVASWENTCGITVACDPILALCVRANQCSGPRFPKNTRPTPRPSHDGGATGEEKRLGKFGRVSLRCAVTFGVHSPRYYAEQSNALRAGSVQWGSWWAWSPQLLLRNFPALSVSGNRSGLASNQSTTPGEALPLFGGSPNGAPP